MAISTRSAGRMNSVPGISFISQPLAPGSQLTSMPNNSRTWPSSPRSSLVKTLQRRSQPSSCDEEVRMILRPVRPGGLVVAALGRLGQDLQLRHGDGALADRRAHAVAARVAAADHDHVLALGGEHGLPLPRGLVVAGHAAVLLAEEVHGQVHAAEVGPGHAQRPRLAGAHAQANRVELAAQLGGR